MIKWWIIWELDYEWCGRQGLGWEWAWAWSALWYYLGISMEKLRKRTYCQLVIWPRFEGLCAEYKPGRLTVTRCFVVEPNRADVPKRSVAVYCSRWFLYSELFLRLCRYKACEDYCNRLVLVVEEILKETWQANKIKNCEMILTDWNQSILLGYQLFQINCLSLIKIDLFLLESDNTILFYLFALQK